MSVITSPIDRENPGDTVEFIDMLDRLASAVDGWESGVKDAVAGGKTVQHTLRARIQDGKLVKLMYVPEVEF